MKLLKWGWYKRVNKWNLRTWFGFGRIVATVYPNGTWVTWNKDGVGGENCIEDSLPKAMIEAELSAIMQGFV